MAPQVQSEGGQAGRSQGAPLAPLLAFQPLPRAQLGKPSGPLAKPKWGLPTPCHTVTKQGQIRS